MNNQTMKTDMHVKNLVIGGGVAGLAIAKRLGDETLIVTKSPIGGLISNETKDGFTFDYGGHVYTTSHPEVVRIMQKSNGHFVAERQAFYDATQYVPFPVQDNASMLGLVVAPQLPLWPPHSLAEYGQVTFGWQFYNEFYEPFNRRVWTSNLDTLSCDWVSGRVKRPDENKEKWGMNSSFWYSPGNRIVSVMMKELFVEGANIAQGELLSIVPNQHYAAIKHDKAGVLIISFENLVTTTPYFVGQMRRNLIFTVGIGLSGMLPSHIKSFHWLYPEVSSKVHRVTLLSRYHQSMAPTGHDSLLLEIPYTVERGPRFIEEMMTEKNRKNLELAAVGLLEDAGFEGFTVADIETVWTAKTLGYPIPNLGGRQYVARQKARLLPYKVFMSGRWGAHGYYNLQHIFDEADLITRIIKRHDFVEENDYVNGNFYYPEKVSYEAV